MPIKSAAVVTGGSSGIGKAILEELEHYFTSCYNLDNKNPDAKTDKFIQTDVADLDAVNAAVQKFSQTGDKLKCIVSNAGIGIHEKLTEGDPVKWKRVIDTNITGTLNVLRAFLPFMDEGGDMIFISSVSANTIYEYGGVYAATKAAINVIADTLRIETDEKIRVTIIEPGLVKSDFLKDTISGSRSYEEVPFQPIDPKAIADAVIYILQQPKQVAINQITIRPSDQKF